MRRQSVIAMVSAALIGAVLAGCGGGGPPQAAVPGTTPAAPAIPTIPMVPNPTTGSTTDPTADAASTTEPAAVPPAPAPAPPAGGAGTRRCGTGDLALEGREAGASAGHRHHTLILTNTGRVTCTLKGYPGVMFLDATWTPAGPPAERLTDDAPVVTLVPGAQAHASLNLAAAYYGTPECGREVEGVTLQVIPPDEYAALRIPYRTTMCSTQPILSVGVIYPGTEMAPGENAGA
jgi:hypothetical protein